MGAHLAKIESYSENNFVRQLGRNYRINHDAWLGLTRGSDNWFYWFDGTRPSYTRWAYNEPNNVGAAEHCGLMYFKGAAKWNDITCDIRKVPRGWKTPIYICEKGIFLERDVSAIGLEGLWARTISCSVYRSSTNDPKDLYLQFYTS